jgi:hypothetical protein
MTTGFYAQRGGDVAGAQLDGLPRRLVVGMHVQVPTVFGTYAMTVNAVDGDHATAINSSGRMQASLEWQDGRGWTSAIAYDPTVKITGTVVDSLPERPGFKPFLKVYKF